MVCYLTQPSPPLPKKETTKMILTPLGTQQILTGKGGNIGLVNLTDTQTRFFHVLAQKVWGLLLELECFAQSNTTNLFHH